MWVIQNAVAQVRPSKIAGTAFSETPFKLQQHKSLNISFLEKKFFNILNKLCAWRHNMPPPLPRGNPSASRTANRRNVAVFSHAEYVPTLTAAAALRVKAELSKAAW